MQIFANSIQETADTFLHAGYISAQPSSMALEYPTLQDTADTGFAVTVEEAFRLAPATAEAAMSAGVFEAMAAAAPPLAVVAATAAALVVVARAAGRRVGSPRLAYGGILGTLLAGVMVLGACIEDPWSNVEPEDYDDPTVATLMLMHSVVKEALTIHHHDAGAAAGLAAVADDIALPVEELSEGVEYALSTYGRDGWSNDLMLEQPDDGQYRVTSGGEDGEIDGSGDLEMDVDVNDLYGPNRTYYLTRRSDTLWLFIRAMPDAWQSNELDGTGDEAGYFFDDRFYGVPLTAEYLEQAWESHGSFGTEDMDWPTIVADLAIFYQQFVTADDPDPVVIQIFDPSFDSVPR